MMNSSDIVTNVLNYEEWLKTKSLADATITQYVMVTKKFLIYGASKDIDNVEVFNEFLFTYAIKKHGTNYFDAIKLFIRFYFQKDAKFYSIIKNLIKKKNHDPKRINKYLDDETRDRVISLLKNYKHRIIAKIQNFTGARAGDILRLKRGTISYEPYNDTTIVMRIDFLGKGDKRFIKWIFDTKLQAQIDLFIKSNILDTEYYFLETYSPNKSVYHNLKRNYAYYLKDLKQALIIYDIDHKSWATHDFRRAFARKVWNQTKDPVVLKEMLNHSNFETTLRYLRGSGLQTKDVYYQLNQNGKLQ